MNLPKCIYDAIGQIDRHRDAREVTVHHGAKKQIEREIDIDIGSKLAAGNGHFHDAANLDSPRLIESVSQCTGQSQMAHRVTHDPRPNSPLSLVFGCVCDMANKIRKIGLRIARFEHGQVSADAADSLKAKFFLRTPVVVNGRFAHARSVRNRVDASRIDAMLSDELECCFHYCLMRAGAAWSSHSFVEKRGRSATWDS